MQENNYVAKDEYVEFCRKIAEVMPKAGMDGQRFGWHDRKAWWQQEQGILAYQILYSVLKEERYLDLARESAAFYNVFFLDHDDGAVYFNVLNNGIPYLLGNERLKGPIP